MPQLNETTAMLLCRLADEHYALPMSHVREVIRWRVPTPVPGTPATILGVIHHRGFVLGITDIRPLLGLPVASTTRSTRLLVVDHGGVQAAIVADAVADIVVVEQDTIEPLPPSIPASHAHLLSALAFVEGKPVTLLNLSTIFEALTVTYAAG